MIRLAEECLVFKLASGENVPFSSDMLSIELMGETAEWFEPEFIREAAKAVFHYFKFEQCRKTITLGEFAEALEKALEGFVEAARPVSSAPLPGVVESDLARLAQESGQGCELLFFPRLRAEVRRKIQESPHVLKFSGLRACVKQLLGVQRWGGRCRNLEEQILEYLRECLSAESRSAACSLVVQ